MMVKHYKNATWFILQQILFTENVEGQASLNYIQVSKGSLLCMPVKRYCLRFAMTCSFRRGATGGCEQTEQVFQFSIGLSNNTAPTQPMATRTSVI